MPTFCYDALQYRLSRQLTRFWNKTNITDCLMKVLFEDTGVNDWFTDECEHL